MFIGYYIPRINEINRDVERFIMRDKTIFFIMLRQSF